MPKKKKQTPEEKLAIFQQWKVSPEFEYLKNLRDLKNQLPEVMEITPDFIGKWGEFLVEFQKLPSMLKVKGSVLKSLAQEQVRTTFFGGVNERDEVFEIDGREFDFINKDVPKNCRHIKNNFVDILKNLDELDHLDEKNYLGWRTNKIIYRYKEFAKFFKEHIKKDKGHTETKKILNDVLAPLRELMEVNFRLTIFETKNTTKRLVEENYFQFKALITDFAMKYQACQEILYKTKTEVIKHNSDFYNILKKLSYEGWESNEFEKTFILPIQDALNKMKANLVKLYSLGFDFWKQPLSNNSKFLDNVAELMAKESKAEFLLGSPLARDQSNFIFKICKEIFNSKIKDGLMNKETKLMDKTIPQLVLLKSMVRINKIFNKKREDFLKHKTVTKTALDGSNKKLDFSLMSARFPGQKITKESLKPESVVYSEGILNIDGTEQRIVFDDNEDYNLENYGRLFLWCDMLPKEEHLTFIEKSRSINNINQAIINDLEDYFIVEGFKPASADYVLNKAEAMKKMTMLNDLIKEEVKNGIPDIRPPNLWNEPSTLQSEHQVRFSINIYSENTDPDIKDLYCYIDGLSNKFKSFNEDRWIGYIDASIEALNKLNAN